MFRATPHCFFRVSCKSAVLLKMSYCEASYALKGRNAVCVIGLLLLSLINWKKCCHAGLINSSSEHLKKKEKRKKEKDKNLLFY